MLYLYHIHISIDYYKCTLYVSPSIPNFTHDVLHRSCLLVMSLLFQSLCTHWTPLNKLPSVHHLHHTVFSQKFTFQVRTFWQSWHTTLRMHCISHSSALFPALWSSAKKMCSGHWAHLSTVSCLPAACPGWSCKNCPDRPQCPSPLVDSTLQHKAVACSAQSSEIKCSSGQ